MHPKQSCYPLTHAQKRIWYTEKMYPGTNFANISLSFELPLGVDIQRLEKVIQSTILEHDGIRLRLVEKHGEVFQYVSSYQSPRIDHISFSSDQEKAIWLREKTNTPFHLLGSELFYFAVLGVNDQFELYINLHHIICDAVAAQLLINEIWRNYNQIKDNDSILEAGHDKPSYLEYIEQDQKYLHSRQFEKNRTFWMEKIQAFPESFNNHNHIKSPQNLAGKRYERKLDAHLCNSISGYCTRHQISPYQFYLSIFLVFLHRITLKNKIVLGTLTHNRSGIREKNMVGMFVNTTPFLMDINTEQSFIDFARDVASEMIGVFRNQKYPYDLLIDDLRKKFKTNEDFIQFIFSYDTLTYALPIQWHANHNEIVPFVFHVTERESNETVKFEIDYQWTHFSESKIIRMTDILVSIIQDALNHPHQEIARLNILTDDERQQIEGYNHTAHDYPFSDPVHVLFENQAKTNPDKTAVVMKDHTIIYRELNERANRLAHALRLIGVRQNDIIGLYVERSIEMVIGMLAILKAGGAYLPIAVDTPLERLKTIVSDSKLKILVTQSRHHHVLENLVERVIGIGDQYSQFPDANQENINNVNDLMYVIYTSGTTGKPKGVLVNHLGFINLLHFHRKAFRYDESAMMSQTASIGFDAMAFEVWPALVWGATLVIASHDIRLDPVRMQEWLIQNQISITFQSTAIAECLIDHDWPSETHLRILLTAGDKLTQYPKKKLPFEFYNLYGPTEDTIWTTCAKIEESDSEQPSFPSIGKPIDNHQVYILDNHNQLQPTGIAGELCIGGIGLARGYLNHEELTKEKFISNPFRQNEILYKTGDFARWLPDGNIEFLGRMDNQVKIRGFRIELGEIESQLLLYELIHEAAVVVKENNKGEKSLCAYIVADSGFDEGEIRDYLSARLPEYMIPWFIMKLDRLPLNSNGKLDRHALPEPSENIHRKTDYLSPRNDVEKDLVEIWHHILGVKDIGIKDNYFILGGDSIKAIQIVYEMQKLGYVLEIADIYKNPTIEGLSPCVQTSTQAADQRRIRGQAKLTPIQQWFFEQNFTNVHYWNQMVVLKTNQQFDADIVQKVFKKIIEHHDALRMVFHRDKDQILQINGSLSDRGFDLTQFDLNDASNVKESMNQYLTDLHHGIDIDHGPLVKLGLFHATEGDYLAVIIHHLVVDGVSWRILIEDFLKGYCQVMEHQIVHFSDKTDAYIHWADALHQYADYPNMRREKKYWSSIDEKESDSLPKDNPIKSRTTEGYLQRTIMLTEDETNSLLKDVHYAYQTDMNDILLTCLGLSFKTWKGMHEMKIAVEGHGREPVDQKMNVARTIGWFTSLYTVCLDIRDENDLGYHIKSIKESMRRIPSKGMGSGILKYISSPDSRKSITEKPAPEICFNYLGQMNTKLINDHLNVQIESFSLETSPECEKPFALEINAVVWDGKLHVVFGYHREEFNHSTIKQLIDIYHQNLKYLIKHCVDKKETEHTPSDYGSADLSFEDLESISAHIDSIE